LGKIKLLNSKRFIKKKLFKKLYPSRLIKSLYFENLNKDSYKDSVEGTLPRKKIRVRNYPNVKKNEFYLEKKISSYEGRFKIKKRLTKLNFEKIIKLRYLGRYLRLLQTINLC
jgi:SPX domain protein involved in polyphosphate accumulation